MISTSRRGIIWATIDLRTQFKCERHSPARSDYGVIVSRHDEKFRKDRQGSPHIGKGSHHMPGLADINRMNR